MAHILDPLNDGISSIELVRSGGSDIDVVNAARVSYGSRVDELVERDHKLIKYLISHDHTSPFEHTQLVYRIKTPIYVVREWMRHRIGVSYNEISGRYAELPMEFYVPREWRVVNPANKQSSIPGKIEKEEEAFLAYKKLIEDASKTYHDLLKMGVCRELARGVLPVCIYTQFIFTCNLISLFHFVRLRAHWTAQWEIQQYAKGLLKLARPHFPISISAWEDTKADPELKQQLEV